MRYEHKEPYCLSVTYQGSSEPALISDQDLLQIQWGWEEEIHPSCFVFETRAGG